MKVVWGKELSQKIFHFSCGCSFDGAYRAFLKLPVQLGTTMAVGEILQTCRPTSASTCNGADSNTPPHVPSGILVSSSFSPGRKEEPVIPLQRSLWHLSDGVDATPPRGKCLSFTFVDWIFLGQNLLKWLMFLLLTLGRAVLLNARDCSGFLLLSSMLCVAIKSFW